MSSGQQSLASLLGDIKSQYGEQYEDAKAGKTPAGDWNNDLPLDLEYRVEVEKCEYKPSKNTGAPQLVVTYVVLEPAEFAGSKFQDYQGLKPNNTVGSEILSRFLGTMQADLNITNEQQFAAQFEGKVVVAALRKWGSDGDRIGTRYINIDKGQTLKTDVKPPKAKGTVGSPLAADIQIPKPPETQAAPVTAPVTPPAPPVEIPTAPAPVAAPGGVNLPPGLQG